MSASETVRPATNVAAIVSLSAAVIGFFLLPILMGPVALIAGIVGEHQARRDGKNLGKIALLGIVLGILLIVGLVL
jgi:hypothetical protein